MTMTRIRAWAALGEKQKLESVVYDAGPLDPEEVEIAVEFCGLCHSDLSILNNDWGVSQYPVILGHEAVGRITAVGDQVKGLRVGQRVGVGWTSASCMHCDQCMTGNQHLCRQAVATIIGHRGGFAEKVRSHWAWAVPLPDSLDISSAGPLLCGGVTVFAPFATYGVKPTHRVGVVGIGGLGHLALQFANAWGCEVTAFSSNPSKVEEVRKLGAHRVVSSRDRDGILKAANSLDFLLVTVNVPLDWSAYLQTLKPNGRMHFVGAVLEPVPVGAPDLISGQKSISGSPTGSPAAISSMLDFASRHHIAPQVEHFVMSKVNDAIAHLAAGKARYRVVLDADFT
ncbi:NADPH-dependent aldehyde reductase Ahr [Nitrosospira sp. Is2]|uniref:NADPH-dependent aldehyde reductase Ahr n=1 Tax=Nitrosospira sp. Is2 TaxID=3080532 RepID=UPI002953F123|nr:NAD(P)-dependent alcohol dehydrogenase [Nitrosospira sp. Is2]WON73440.1 NAD(P)-dependent alcohol dehydrogenase [Nitrosospira sp. Is2]